MFTDVRALGAAAALVVSVCGQAMAGDGGRGKDYRNGMNHAVIHLGGNDRHDGHGRSDGRSYGDRGSTSRSSFSLNIGVGSGYCGDNWSSSYRYSSGPHYRSDYYTPRYCPPPVVIAPCPPPVIVVRDRYQDYCPPPVVIAPCPPPIIVVRDRYEDYCPPRRVIVADPVVIERPVYVDRQVVVDRPVYVEKQVVVERVVERPAQPAPTPTAPTSGTYRDRELGDAYLRMGDMENATRVYARYLAAWDKDGTATRNLGLAQVASGFPQEGFRNVVTGYKLEPGLISRQLRVQDVGGSAGFSRLLDAATRSADGINTPDAWLTVAVLNDMNLQRDAAIVALQKARDAGLDAATLDAFTIELSK